MEEETEERKRRKKKTAGEEEATVECVVIICLSFAEEASKLGKARERSDRKQRGRKEENEAACSLPLAAWPWGALDEVLRCTPAAAASREDTREVLRLRQAAAERHLSQEEENIRIKHGAEETQKGVSSCSALGYEEREALRSLTRHTWSASCFSGFIRARTAYKAGWTASSTLLATLLALLSHLYRPVALKLSVNREEGPALLLLLGS
ncbi:hypothetical protein H113_02724 [Trichophyton rubrum MR1459]|uniref:Uncharacterized protein n=2 Tax=Trichophyton TaxID=5550 RepID=A0A022W7Z9_TRIRU|nr:hypothetical protein H100_02718 [Trichophyton rubrum MR850]EZF54540.1 hypothetical protein H103_02722 [Trichophyton rubrum CBS 288.86]EZF65107.1 hypothetical protein H104_02701 [Trichophyton rubrum CBS 289.86]EZF75774.1 hypothetical protein H105_02728 [Trichophyton soudanense CBS 452.61]EZF86437.1 hypothetical protein H110_02721 [Trichophyton rubrum MR1448]EZF97196.1 hypothetical protein H113_02724 [Trichophyton rubrum MR1459]EZG09330.1 hypothetical protein H106_01544 [Trichophyton rubrum 